MRAKHVEYGLLAFHNILRFEISSDMMVPFNGQILCYYLDGAIG
jgi:hypothetical protein